MTDPAADPATDTEAPTSETRSIDLDAARKARREKRGVQPSIVFLGEKRPLPYDLPATVIDMVGDLSAGDFTASTKAFRLLLGGEVYEKLIADAEEAGDPLELPDVVFLLEQALELYEVTLPESVASASSS